MLTLGGFLASAFAFFVGWDAGFAAGFCNLEGALPHILATWLLLPFFAAGLPFAPVNQNAIRQILHRFFQRASCLLRLWQAETCIED